MTPTAGDVATARVVDGAMVTCGDTVVVAVTAPAGNGALFSPAVRYQVLCHGTTSEASWGPTRPVRGRWPSPDHPVGGHGGPPSHSVR